ncbi:hypothetical protein [Mesorhizobium sp. 1M-11]|uniref:hypothetical protein n=1 Tax=Mesorhizobium sp. 1M-11 TaxID=1529006 RepID=UPI0006C76716|nr:hypothetical protein [Mesorhizobium sp. 1M-11]
MRNALIVEEKFASTDGTVSVTFSIFGFDQEKDGFRSVRVVLSEDGKQPRTKKLPGLTEFQCLLNAITVIGIDLRGIAKDRAIEFDLDGISLADHIPLGRSLREIWDE